MWKKKFYQLKRKLFPRNLKSQEYLYLLEKSGIKIGKGTIFYNPSTTVIDCSRPCLLSIGKYCKITSGVIILTHDYSRSVLRMVYGDIIGEAKQTIIGNNVFIGMNSIILMGAKIGNNVIIGAGSVVSGTIPDNVVIAGNPACIIRTLDEHYKIRLESCLKEAKWYAQHFTKYYGRIPTIKEMDPFYPLFLERDLDKVIKNDLTIKLGGDNYNDVVDKFLSSRPIYDGYELFLQECDLI